MKKVIRFDKRAEKEFKKFGSVVQAKIKAIIDILARDGKLIEPFSKKIDKYLFEIRIVSEGQYRLLYAYLIGEYIIILSAFQKKTQQTPLKEIKKAKDRLNRYKII
ncbi:MAG: hypothetical protein ACD_19C00182G0015 [uncultured bacterium]|nr:MAG: hypothetical protein ACD_19C00182G0015 [uncultured bacterium]